MVHMIHGVAIRRKKDKELVQFMETGYGMQALRVLSGVRHNLDDKNYYAEEDIVEKSDVDKMKKEHGG